MTGTGAAAVAVPPPHPRRWAGLAVLSASLVLIVMDITILNVALPEMSAELRPGSVELLWMVDAYSLVVSGLLVTAASLGDRWGRRRMLVAGFAVFGLASLGILVADSPGEVIAIRALLGVGGAGFLLIFFAGQPLGYWPVAVALFLVGAGMGALAIASAVIMAGSPPERSGSAAAIEETSYELGATLGVAVLGSIAAVVYRAGLSGSDLAGHGVTGRAAHDARESLGGAIEVARGIGAAGNGLAARAQEAFTTSLSWASVTGGALMLAAAALVWALTPRDLDIAEAEGPRADAEHAQVNTVA